MLRDATASASACSSFARRSGFLDTASTSLPLHVGDLVSPFSSAVRRRGIAIKHKRLRTSLSTREYGHEIRTGESQDTCRSVEMRGVSSSGGERLFARSLYRDDNREQRR